MEAAASGGRWADGLLRRHGQADLATRVVDDGYRCQAHQH
jgi:hypothetical protein